MRALRGSQFAVSPGACSPQMWRCVLLAVLLVAIASDNNCTDSSSSLADDECALWQQKFSDWGGQKWLSPDTN